MDTSAVSPILNPNVEHAPWGWNPLSAYFTAYNEAQANSRAQAELAMKQQLLPSELALKEASAAYYGAHKDYYEAKAAGGLGKAGSSILEPGDAPTPSESAQKALELSPSDAKVMGIGDATEESDETVADTAPSRSQEVDGNAWIQENGLQNSPIKDLIASGSSPKSALSDLLAPGDAPQVGPVASGQSTDAGPRVADTAPEIPAVDLFAPGASTNMLADANSGLGTDNNMVTPEQRAIASLANDKTAASALYPGLSGAAGTNVLNKVFGGDAKFDSTKSLSPSPSASSSEPAAKDQFDFGGAIATYGQKMKEWQLQQAKAEADYKDALRHTTAAFANKQPNIYKAALQKKADAEYLYNGFKDKQLDLTKQMALRHGIAPTTLQTLANEDPAKINFIKKNYIDTKKAPDFVTASTMFAEDIKRGNKNGEDTPIVQATKNLQNLQGTLGNVSGDEYFQAQGLLKDAHDQVFNATLTQKANELGALQQQYQQAVSGNASANDVTALRTALEAKQNEISGLRQARVATQRSYTGGVTYDQYTNATDKAAKAKLWPSIEGFARTNSPDGGFTIPADPQAAMPVLQKVVEASQKLPPRSPILVNGKVILSNPNYTVNDLQAQFVGSGEKKAIAPASGWLKAPQATPDNPLLTLQDQEAQQKADQANADKEMAQRAQAAATFKSTQAKQMAVKNAQAQLADTNAKIAAIQYGLQKDPTAGFGNSRDLIDLTMRQKQLMEYLKTNQ